MTKEQLWFHIVRHGKSPSHLGIQMSFVSFTSVYSSCNIFRRQWDFSFLLHEIAQVSKTWERPMSTVTKDKVAGTRIREDTGIPLVLKHWTWKVP